MLMCKELHDDIYFPRLIAPHPTPHPPVTCLVLSNFVCAGQWNLSLIDSLYEDGMLSMTLTGWRSGNSTQCFTEE